MRFRLIYDAHHAGDVNMARDEAISHSVGRGEQLPTLRFYSWQPAAISLGQSMRHSAVDWAACARDGVGVVRRTTGGLAILHTDELTYSICLPKAHPLVEGDVMTSYRRISVAILEALRRLGVREPGAQPVPKELKATGPVCFEAPSDYEVVGVMHAPSTADGHAPGLGFARPPAIKKLVGSAQQRRLDAVLQHGSLPLTGDIGRICGYLHGAPDAAAVRARAGTLAEAVGREIPWREAATVWAQAFADVLGLELVEGDLSAAELAQTTTLLGERYANDAWTKRR